MITNITWSVGVALGAPDRNTVPWILEDKRLTHINKKTHTKTRAWSTWFFVNLMSTRTHREKGQRAWLYITRFDGTTVSKWNTLPYSAFFFPFCTSLSVFSLLSHSQHHIKRRTRFVALRSRFLCLNWYDSRGLQPLQAFYREAFFFLFIAMPQCSHKATWL